MKIEKAENGIVTISQKGLGSKRKINLFEAKKWMVNRWYDKRFNDASRDVIAQMLSDASGMDEKQMTDMENLKKSEVIAKIKGITIQLIILPTLNMLRSINSIVLAIQGAMSLGIFKLVRRSAINSSVISKVSLTPAE